MTAADLANRLPLGPLRGLADRVQASPLGMRMARGAFWSLLAAVITRGLGMVSTILCARILGKAGYGELGIINSTTGIFGVVAGFGLGVTATRYVAEFREKDPLRAGRILTMSAIVYWVTGGVATLLLFALAPWLAAKTLVAPHLAGSLRIGAVLLLLGAVNGGQFGALSGFEAFRSLSLLSVVTGCLHFPCVVLGCWWFGLNGALWGLVAASMFGVVLTRWAIIVEARRFGVPLFVRRWSTELPVLWRFSLPTLAAGLLVTPTIWFCQTLLARQPGGYGGLAEYTVAASWRGMVQCLPDLLSSAYLPVAASLHTGSTGRYRRLMWATIAATVGVTLIAAVAVFAASPWILRSYGAGFSAARWALALMLVTGVVDAANGTLMRTLLSCGKAYLRLISNSVWCLLVVGFSLWFIPRYGATGMAAAICLAQSVHLAIQVPLTLMATRRVQERGSVATRR